MGSSGEGGGGHPVVLWQVLPSLVPERLLPGRPEAARVLPEGGGGSGVQGAVEVLRVPGGGGRGGQEEGRQGG